MPLKRGGQLREDLCNGDIRELYINKMLSAPEIAEKFNCACCTIYWRLKEMGIKVRSRSEARKISYEQGRHPRNCANAAHRFIREDGYALIKANGHPRGNVHGYMMEHILIWEQVHNK